MEVVVITVIVVMWLVTLMLAAVAFRKFMERTEVEEVEPFVVFPPDSLEDDEDG
jgi:hypothetical protein